MRRTSVDFIKDILELASDAHSFVLDTSYEAFSRDKKTQYAVIRALEVIGEAAKNVDGDIRRRYPEVPWREMSGMRDKLIHGYFGVKPDRVWFTASSLLPRLQPELKRILRELEADEA